MMLYSVNVYLKLFIQQIYYNDIHYVWCSENYDSRLISPHLPGHQVPPTSNPAEIYERLRIAIDRFDTHDYKIDEQKRSIKDRAVTSCINGIITDTQRDEIIAYMETPVSNIWRPIVYNIPKAGIDPSRIEAVPMKLRAGIGIEYKIKDLKNTEFFTTEP